VSEIEFSGEVFFGVKGGGIRRTMGCHCGCEDGFYFFGCHYGAGEEGLEEGAVHVCIVGVVVWVGGSHGGW